MMHDQDVRGAAAVFGRTQRLALYLGFVLLVALRLPRAWVHGRFMGEEGTVFLAFAWHRSAGEALWRSFAGYLNLGANGTTLLTARLVQHGPLPLEFAPYLTMGLALFCQSLPAILLLTSRSRWLASRWAVVAALLLVAMAPRTEEVFFNILHIQFHLALCAALILALDPPRSPFARIGQGAILLLAPLCGPGAIVLLPFFGLRALMERDRARLEQTAAFSAGVLLQLLVFFTLSPVRGHLLDPATLGAILFVRLIALPLLSAGPADAVGHLIQNSYIGGSFGWWLAPAGALACFGLLLVLALRDRRDAALWLIAPGLALAIISFGGGMIETNPREWFSTSVGERYNFLPIVLIGLGLIALARRPGRYRHVYAGLCALTLISGAGSYARPIAEVATGPNWAKEVAAWRRDHDYRLASWPADWRIDLSDRSRPCPTPAANRDAAADPRYCESAWLAGLGSTPENPRPIETLH